MTIKKNKKNKILVCYFQPQRQCALILCSLENGVHFLVFLARTLNCSLTL